MSEDYDTMPKSMRKKWELAKYGKERYLANKFIESRAVKESRVEQKLRQIIKEEIRRLLQSVAHTLRKYKYYK